MKILLVMTIWGFIFYLSDGWSYLETKSEQDRAEIPVIVDSFREIYLHRQSQEPKELETLKGFVRSDFVENCLILQIPSSSFKFCGENWKLFVASLEKETSSNILASLSWEPMEGFIHTSKERNFRIEKKDFSGVGYIVMQFPVFRSGYVEYKPSDLYMDDTARRMILNQFHSESDQEINIAGITSSFVTGR